MPEPQISQEDLDQARGEREGLEWLKEQSELELPGGAPSQTPISTDAFNLIVEFEVSSEQVYSKQYRQPTWPQGASGLTIGIGYDVGYVTKVQLWGDWKDAIPDAMISALEPALGVTGLPARQITQGLKTKVDVPWDAAISVHRGKVIPLWVGLVERSLPNTNPIGPDCLGALVSLTYNRGASFDKVGDRYLEMRNIKTDMQGERYSDIPGEYRSMKRLWPTVRGLRDRREREAELFEAGLASLKIS
jgi:GH24 family phage-related lysozyme (muramidase)